MNDPLLNTLIGARYLLAEVVGRGGMGVVYRAKDTRLAGRECAVKLLSTDTFSPVDAQRFERELRIISQMHSPHVVQVLDTGILDDGRRFIVMELLLGKPLSKLLARRALSPDGALQVIKGVVVGLVEAHKHGVVHRDLKPANVFVTRTEAGVILAKVLDFGVSKEHGASPEGTLTTAGAQVGTPRYMAPEQFLQKPADARTDLYAAGLLLYEMLAGRAPFTDDGNLPDSVRRMSPAVRIGWLHINRAPAPLPVEPRLWALVDRLLAKDPEARFPDAIAVGQALAALSMPALPTRSKGHRTPELGPGSVLGGHRLVQKLARIGLVQRWEARHERLDRGAILEVFSAHVPAGSAMEGQCIEVARQLAGLQGNGGARLLESGFTSDRAPYLIFEEVEGESLANRLHTAGHLSTDETWAVGAQILRTLSEAHALDCPHGDLRPEDIYLSRAVGTQGIVVKVVGFGAATLKRIVAGGAEVVTPDLRFVSPECLEGGPISVAADLYAFGAILYGCACGELPFRGTEATLREAHRYQVPGRLPARFPLLAVPVTIDDLVQRCLEKAPTDRPASADEARALLANGMEPEDASVNGGGAAEVIQLQDTAVEHRPVQIAAPTWMGRHTNPAVETAAHVVERPDPNVGMADWLMVSAEDPSQFEPPEDDSAVAGADGLPVSTTPGPLQLATEGGLGDGLPDRENMRVGLAQARRSPARGRFYMAVFGLAVVLTLGWVSRSAVVRALALGPGDEGSLGEQVSAASQDPEHDEPVVGYDDATIEPVAYLADFGPLDASAFPRSTSVWVTIDDERPARFIRVREQSVLCERANGCRVPVDEEVQIEREGSDSLLLSGDDLFDRRGGYWRVHLRPKKPPEKKKKKKRRRRER